MASFQELLNNPLTTFSRGLAAGPAVSHVNLSAWDVMQKGVYPWRVWAVTALKAPDSDGLPTDDEQKELIDAERELLSRVPNDEKSVFLGNFQHQFHHVTILHSRAPDLLGATEAVRIKGRRYTWHVYTENDPNYNFLRQKFLPSEAEFRRHRDSEILRLLADAGDRPMETRVINFYGMFHRLQEAEAAAGQLTKKGFRPSAPSEMPKQAYPWSLMFQRVSTTDAASIETLTQVCESVCTSCNGFYDGWECEVVK